MKLHFIQAICCVLVIGLGQIIKGESKKGVILLLAFYFFLPAIVYVSLLINAIYFIYVLGSAVIFGIMLWVYSIGDALLKS